MRVGPRLKLKSIVDYFITDAPLNEIIKRMCM